MPSPSGNTGSSKVRKHNVAPEALALVLEGFSRAQGKAPLGSINTA